MLHVPLCLPEQLVMLEKLARRYRDKVWKVRGLGMVLRVAETGRQQSIIQVIHETTDRFNLYFPV
jgi:hypothetical protein